MTLEQDGTGLGVADREEERMIDIRLDRVKLGAGRGALAPMTAVAAAASVPCSSTVMFA